MKSQYLYIIPNQKACEIETSELVHTVVNMQGLQNYFYLESYIGIRLSKIQTYIHVTLNFFEAYIFYKFMCCINQI